jgi:predicted ATP-dependent protease
VLIPQANIKHLVLRPDVVEAVEQDRFHVYPVARIDEGIELLTGMPAGTPGPDGEYPEGTVFRKVADRLRAMAELRQKFGRQSTAEAANDGRAS